MRKWCRQCANIRRLGILHSQCSEPKDHQTDSKQTHKRNNIDEQVKDSHIHSFRATEAELLKTSGSDKLLSEGLGREQNADGVQEDLDAIAEEGKNVDDQWECSLQ